MPWYLTIFWSVNQGILRIASMLEEGIDNLVQKLAIVEEEAVEVVFSANIVTERSRPFYVVGELLTHKDYRKEALVNVFRSLWIPARDQGDKSLFRASFLDGSNQIFFSFKRETDRRWALGGALWDFEKCLFVVAATDGMEDPRAVSLRFSPFWIRVRGLPLVVLEDDKREATGRCIGSVLGNFIKCGWPSGRERQDAFLRIRVEVDVEAPLRKRFSFRVAGEAKSELYDIEYEHLPFFCLFCGMLSHTGNACPGKAVEAYQEPRFSVCLNAERKERWLQEQKLAQVESQSNWVGGGTLFGFRSKDGLDYDGL